MLFKDNYKIVNSPWVNKIYSGQDPNSQDLLDHLHIIHNRHAGFTEKIANDLNLIDKNKFAFCWIVDYPMFEMDQKTKKIKFSHNPFSMPQGDIKKLNLNNPLEIKAFQYDIVCNGVELSSGAIRNHIPELMYKLFSIAGYDLSLIHI